MKLLCGLRRAQRIEEFTDVHGSYRWYYITEGRWQIKHNSLVSHNIVYNICISIRN